MMCKVLQFRDLQTKIWLLFQTEKRFNAFVQQKESAVSQGWLLLEEAKRRKDDEGGSHEAQSARNWGKSSLTFDINNLVFIDVHVAK